MFFTLFTESLNFFVSNHRESLAQSPFIDILRLFLFTSAQIAQCDFSDPLELRSPNATISRTFVSLQYKNCWKPKSNIHYLIPPHQYHWTSHRVNSLCCLVPEVLRFCIVNYQCLYKCYILLLLSQENTSIITYSDYHYILQGFFRILR